MLQGGTILNQRYEILAMIGGGGMSLVYRARDLQTYKIVAIKVLRDQYASDPTFIARFRREGVSVAGLDHPNIVKVFSVSQDGDIYYLVMEMVEGMDLKQVLQEKGPYSPRVFYPMMAQICDAIAYAHDKGIVHRDIKPHNIILRPDGQVKVTDFGIARAASEATMTHTGSIMGSVHYLAPEQAKGEIADTRSDIYALGVLLYELLTGRLPHEGESAVGVAVQKIQKDPEPPRRIKPEMTTHVEKVILRALQRRPDQRYETVDQLKEDFREACFNNRVLFEPKHQVMDQTLQHRLSDIQAGLDEEAPEGGSLKNKNWLKHWPPWARALGLFVLLALGGLVTGVVLSSFMNQPTDVVLPDLTGEHVEEALEALEVLGLMGRVQQERVFHQDLPRDAVVSQSPSAQTPVLQGSTVDLIISAGPVMVEVPDLTGLTQQEAEVALIRERLLLDREVVEEHHPQIPAGQVLRQEPSAKTLVKEQALISIVLSKGPLVEMIQMESFVGMPLDDAMVAARNLGIDIGTVEHEMSWTFAKGVVVKQSPAGGARVPAGTSAQLVVSAGPGPDPGDSDEE